MIEMVFPRETLLGNKRPYQPGLNDTKAELHSLVGD